MSTRSVFCRICTFVALASFSFAAPPGWFSPTTVHGRAHNSDSGTVDGSVAYLVNAQHSGDLPNDSLVPPLIEQWAVDLGSDSYGNAVSYPLVVGDHIFVATAKPPPKYGILLYALDIATGKVAWGPVALAGTYSWIGLAYDGGRVFAINYDGRLTAFEASTGQQDWTVNIGSFHVTSPPTALDGVVYVAGGDGVVAAVNASNGTMLWQTQLSGGVDQSSPAVTSSGVYVGATTAGQCSMFDLTPANGSQIWKTVVGCPNGSRLFTPAVSGGRVYIRSVASETSGPTQTILDAGTGTPEGIFGASFPPALDGSFGFFLSTSIDPEQPGAYQEATTLSAVNETTGQTLWTFTGDGFLRTAPVVVNGTVYVGSASGAFYGLNETTGGVEYLTNLPVPISGTSEYGVDIPTGVAIGSGLLVVEAAGWLIAFNDSRATPATATRTGISTSSKHSVYGSTLTFSALVNPVGSARIVSLGTVDFVAVPRHRGAAVTLCSTVAIVDLGATCISSSLRLGTYSVYAHYSGDGKLAPSTRAHESRAVQVVQRNSQVRAADSGMSDGIQATAIVGGHVPGGAGTVWAQAVSGLLDLSYVAVQSFVRNPTGKPLSQGVHYFDLAVGDVGPFSGATILDCWLGAPHALIYWYDRKHWNLFDPSAISYSKNGQCATINLGLESSPNIDRLTAPNGKGLTGVAFASAKTGQG